MSLCQQLLCDHLQAPSELLSDGLLLQEVLHELLHVCACILPKCSNLLTCWQTEYRQKQIVLDNGLFHFRCYYIEVLVSGAGVVAGVSVVRIKNISLFT